MLALRNLMALERRLFVSERELNEGAESVFAFFGKLHALSF
ncbi:MAG: hypothetical protein LZF86_190585 [Nitrospira sp.]|nr:MAG: hypothetical protein LZF86_190585 [Nitrospira sp.]